MRIAKGINPIGTTQLVRSQTKTGYKWVKYKVIDMTGTGTFAPNDGGPVIYMELSDRAGAGLQQYLSLPLSAFDQRVLADTKVDQFWETESISA